MASGIVWEAKVAAGVVLKCSWCKRAMYMFFVSQQTRWPFLTFPTQRAYADKQNDIVKKNTKVIVGKIVQKIDFEKHNLLPFSFSFNQSGRREPMWMESLRSKALADFCKRHLFKFCTFSTSEGGCLCFGAKNSAACQVLEDVASSDFSSKQELHLLAIKKIFF